MSLPSIILDTDKTAPFYELPLKIRQGDTGDELQVTLGKSFQKYTDLSTVDVELIAKTPDQRLIKQPVTDKSGNTFKVKFPDEMYTNVGVFRNMYFKIGDDSTSSIKLVVLQGIGSIKEAGSYIDDFETLIKEAESYVLALKDFSDTGNAKIDSKVAELTGKMQSFVDKSKEDLDAAKAAWSTFQSSSQTEFTGAQDKRASDFNSQKSGFETDFNEQKIDFENRFKALLATLQGDYDSFKALINKDVADFNTSLDSLDSRYDAIKIQLDALEVPEIGGRNYLLGTTDNLTTVKGNGYTAGVSSYKVDMVCSADTTFTARAWLHPYAHPMSVQIVWLDASEHFQYNIPEPITAGSSGYSTCTVTVPAGGKLKYVTAAFDKSETDVTQVDYKEFKLEKGNVATDWCPNPSEIATNDGVQTSIKNALGNYSTTAEVDKKISTGVGQAKTYAEQSIKGIIGAAPETLDTIGELADAVTKNKDGVQAINDGITKKADKTELANYESKAEVISQTDYEAKKAAGTLENKFYIVTDDTEAS